MVRTFNDVVNLGGQSCGEGGGIGCGQRSSAGSDVINCDEFLVMFSKLPPFLSCIQLCSYFRVVFHKQVIRLCTCSKLQGGSLSCLLYCQYHTNCGVGRRLEEKKMMQAGTKFCYHWFWWSFSSPIHYKILQRKYSRSLIHSKQHLLLGNI